MPGNLKSDTARQDRLHFVVVTFAIALVASVVSIMMPHTGPLASIWIPNALVVGLLLSRGVDYEGPSLLAFGVAVVGTHYFLGLGGLTGAMLGLANVAEVLIAVALIRMLCGANPDPGDLRMLGRIIGPLAVAAGTSATIAGFVVGPSVFSAAIAGPWFLRNVATLVFLAPLMLVLANAISPDAPDLPAPRPLFKPIVAGVTLATAAIFALPHMSLLFAVAPLLATSALLLRLRGTTTLLAIVGVIAIAATQLHLGPLSLLADGDLRSLVVMLFLAAQTLVALPPAALVEQSQEERAEHRRKAEENDRTLDSIAEVVFTLDPGGRWTSLNAAWERVTGYTRGETMGTHVTDLLPESDAAAMREQLGRLQGGETDFLRSRHEIRTRNGKRRDIEIYVSGTRDNFNIKNGFAGSIRDVSAAARQQRELLSRDREFETLANLAPAGFWRTDAKGNSTYTNPALREQTGLDEAAMLGDGWATAIHPDDFEKVYYDWKEAVAKRSLFFGRWRWLRPDGTIVWAETRGAPHLDENGTVLGFIGITNDVTEQVAAERIEVQREAQVRTIANTVRDGLFMLGSDNKVLFASRYAGEMLELPADSLVDGDFATLFGPEAEDGIAHMLAALWAGRDRGELVLRYAAVDGGEPAMLDAQFARTRDGQGEDGDAVVVSIRDVTEDKQFERELRNARRTAEHAARSKASFLANMSHEIRTPMNGVLGFADLLLETDLDEGQRRNVKLIAESGKSMMRLLNDILDITKIETGNLVMELEPVDLRHKLRSCMRLMEPVANEKGVAVEFEVADDVPERIVGDPLRLRQILLNLIGNAVKFTEKGTVRAVARVDGAGAQRHLVLEVHDSGIGIEPEKLQLIFKEFAQGDGTIGRRYGGSGLGLAISSHLARLMGGTINVTSTRGVGSVFTLRLKLEEAQCNANSVSTVPKYKAAIPLAIAAPSRDAADRECADPGEVVGDGDRDIRVLIAEDHDIN